MSSFVLTLIDVCRAAEQEAAKVVEQVRLEVAEWKRKAHLARENRCCQEKSLSAALDKKMKDAVATSVKMRALFLPSDSEMEEMEALRRIDAEVEFLEKKTEEAAKKEQVMSLLLTYSGRFFSESMKARGRDPFDILGLDENLVGEELRISAKKSWKELSKRFHPDKTRVRSGTFDTMTELVSTAQKILTSEELVKSADFEENMTMLDFWHNCRDWEKVTQVFEESVSASRKSDDDYGHEELEGAVAS
jgi:hypothetical protein